MGPGEALEARGLPGVLGQQRVHRRVVAALPGPRVPGRDLLLGRRARRDARREPGRERQRGGGDQPHTVAAQATAALRVRCAARDGARLDHPGLRYPPRALRLRQGFVVGALALAGFVGGALAGGRLAPALLEEGARSPYAPLFALIGALLGGGLLAVGLETVGRRVRGALRIPGFGVVDGLLGALLSGALALGLAWIFGAVALQTPGARELRGTIQRSEILSRLNSALPPSGPLLNALARFDPFPQISGPEADVAPPRAAIARDPQVRAASVSVVRLRGTACGLGVTGTGWVAREGLVVTNAHVVAGQDDTIVQVGGEEPDLPASRRRLRRAQRHRGPARRGARPAALTMASEPSSGTAGAILGYPEDGPYDVRAARIGATQTVVSQDAYGRGPLRRPMTSLRGTVPLGQLGRAGRQRIGRGAHHDLRLDDRPAAARRLRRAQRGRPPPAGRRAGPGLHRSVRALTQLRRSPAHIGGRWPR
jgi:hypothetical protein